MDYKPSDLFVGVIDVFAILLPGSLLAFTVKDIATHHIFGPILPVIQGEAQGWVAFIFATYLLGHFIFLIGSYLDKTLYDPYRKIVFMRDHDQLYKYATEIKRRQLQDMNGTALVNTFKWSKANIQLHHAAAAIEINRLEADSKFFRSLIVVLFLVSISLLYQVAWIELSLCLGLMLLAFLRYADQRFKSTELAYTYFVARAHGAQPETHPGESPSRAGVIEPSWSPSVAE
jgi:hypothetical protein